MEYLQDVLFGEKTAISANLLSLAKSISLKDSEKLLTQFYESNKDSLDASYKLVEKVGDKTQIKIVGSQDLPEENSGSRIYIVSPQRANDPVIVAEVGKRVRQLQLSAKLKDIVASGVYVNPLLDSEFVAATQLSKKPLGELKREIPPQRKPETKAPAPASLKKEPTAATNSTVPVSKPVSKPTAFSKSSAATPQTKSATLNSSGTSSNKEKKASPSRGSAQQKPSKFPFQGTTKEEALKSGRKATSLPVSERIVMATHDSDEDVPEPEDDLKKEQQMKNLSKLYDDDGEDAQKPIDEPSQSEAEEDEFIEKQDEMDMDPIIPAPEEASEEANGETTEKSEKVLAKPAQPVETVRKTSPPAPKNRTRRVLKTIVTKDEEGFDVRKQVWVDEPIESSEENQLPGPQAVGSENVKSLDHPAKEAATKEESKDTGKKRTNENSGATENTGARQVKRSKAPPTIKKANQTSLMSFFSSK